MTRTSSHLLTAAVLTVAVAACGGPADPADQPQDPAPDVVEDPTDATEDADAPEDDDAPEDADAPGDDDTSDAPAEDAEPASDVTDLEGVEVQPEGQELMLRIDDEVLIVGLLDPEGESFYRHATIWPGSTRDDLTIVAVSQAEGMYDLRWLTVTDGAEDTPVQAFPTHLQPDTEMVAAADVAPNPVFSPDGDSLAWLDWNAEGAVSLRTVGWDEGPGTGRTEDDNASFALDELPAGVQLQSWEAVEGDTSELHVTDQEGESWTITIRRQADGALALPPGALEQD